MITVSLDYVLPYIHAHVRKHMCLYACMFTYIFNIYLYLYMSEGLGIRSPKKSFQVPTWLVFETAIDNTGLKEAEHLFSVSALQGGRALMALVD